MKSMIIVIISIFVLSMLTVSSVTTVSSSAISSTKPAPPSVPVKIHFDTDTTIKDIVAIHNSGIPFDKYVAKISAAAKGQNATISQIRAWNYIQSLVKINADVCSLNQQLKVNTRDPSNIIMSSFLLPPPPKTVCDSKMSFAYEVCQGDPSIVDCSIGDNIKFPSKDINNYIKTQNLHDGAQTDNLAYEELEVISVTLNHGPHNTTSNIVHFENSDLGTAKS